MSLGMLLLHGSWKVPLLYSKSLLFHDPKEPLDLPNIFLINLLWPQLKIFRISYVWSWVEERQNRFSLDRYLLINLGD